jgi:hypothetical protein
MAGTEAMAAGMAAENAMNDRRERQGDKVLFIMAKLCQWHPFLATAP